jgi:hypothetical protein
VSETARRRAPRPTLSFVDTLRKDAADTEVRVTEVTHADAPPDIAPLPELGDRRARASCGAPPW